MLSNWPWISRCGDYWQQAELRTDGACRIMMMMMMTAQSCTISEIQWLTGLCILPPPPHHGYHLNIPFGQTWHPLTSSRHEKKFGCRPATVVSFVLVSNRYCYQTARIQPSLLLVVSAQPSPDRPRSLTSQPYHIRSLWMWSTTDNEPHSHQSSSDQAGRWPPAPPQGWRGSSSVAAEHGDYSICPVKWTGFYSQISYTHLYLTSLL